MRFTRRRVPMTAMERVKMPAGHIVLPCLLTGRSNAAHWDRSLGQELDRRKIREITCISTGALDMQPDGISKLIPFPKIRDP